jgi:hypothetical protein
MDYLKLKEMRMKKIKQLLEKKDPEQLRFILSLEKGKKPFNPKRKPHKIKITGPKRVTSKSKSRISKRVTSKSKSRISKNRILKSKSSKRKIVNPLLKYI